MFPLNEALALAAMLAQGRAGFVVMAAARM
jgi:hypothetical protein